MNGNGAIQEHLVPSGQRLRLEGSGVLVHPYTGQVYVEVQGEIIWTVPDGVRVVGAKGDLVIDILPPDRERVEVALEPNRTYTVVCQQGDVVIETLKRRQLVRIDRDDRQRWVEFTTPPDLVAARIDKSGSVLIAETPLVGTDFQPEIDALNAKLERKGFVVMPRKLQRVVIEGIDGEFMAVDEVGLSIRGVQAPVHIAKDTLVHGRDAAND